MMPPHILHIKTINLTNTITPSPISNQEQFGTCYITTKIGPKSSEIKTQFHRENHHREITVII